MAGSGDGSNGRKDLRRTRANIYEKQTNNKQSNNNNTTNEIH